MIPSVPYAQGEKQVESAQVARTLTRADVCKASANHERVCVYSYFLAAFTYEVSSSRFST